MVHDMLPFALRGVERCSGRFLTVCVLLTMSRSSRVVRGMQRPSRWMREVQVVAF
jgi:hypothetical protein